MPLDEIMCVPGLTPRNSGPIVTFVPIEEYTVRIEIPKE